MRRVIRGEMRIEEKGKRRKKMDVKKEKREDEKRKEGERKEGRDKIE